MTKSYEKGVLRVVFRLILCFLPVNAANRIKYYDFPLCSLG